MHRRTFLTTATLGITALGARPTSAALRPVPDWELGQPDPNRLSPAGLDALKAYLQEKGTRSALVIRNGRIIREWFWEGSRADTRFPVYSITKSFAATAVGFLEADGKLKLDQPAADFIPEWRSDDRKGILIRHLLSMSSGMSKSEQVMYGLGDKVGFALTQPLQSPPGTKWDYNNIGCAALSRVILGASGVQMSRYLRQKLYEPIGITQYEHEEPAGHTLPYSGLQITARDLARFGYLYLNQGLWGKQIVLPSRFVSEATSTSQELNRGYGYLWWVNTAGAWADLPRDAYAARGAFGNELLVLPEKNLMVVRMVGTKPQAGVDLNQMGKLALAACTEKK